VASWCFPWKYERIFFQHRAIRRRWPVLQALFAGVALLFREGRFGAWVEIDLEHDDQHCDRGTEPRDGRQLDGALVPELVHSTVDLVNLIGLKPE
jgi:hypothetical protein